MAKKRRQAKIPTPAWDRPRGTLGSRVLGRDSRFYGMVGIGALLVLALGIIGFAFLSDYLERQGRPGSTAVQVEDTRFRLDYFTKRLKIFVDQNGGPGAVDATGALSQVPDLLIQEEIIRRFAGEFDLSATEDEIREEIASRLGITADDESFDIVFEQELVRSELSEIDYREMIEAAVLETKLRDKFESEVPASAESVHYRQILVSTDERAQEIKDELDGGADFVALAADDSNLDVATKDNGGDVGWVPRGLLDASTEELIFALETGAVGVIPSPLGVHVIEMLEKDDNREVSDDLKGALASGALADWVREKEDSLSIVVNNMDLSGGDREKIEWAVSRAFQQVPTQQQVPIQGGHGG